MAALSICDCAQRLGIKGNMPLGLYKNNKGMWVYITGNKISELYHEIAKAIYPDITDEELAKFSAHSIRVMAAVLLCSKRARTTNTLRFVCDGQGSLSSYTYVLLPSLQDNMLQQLMLTMNSLTLYLPQCHHCLSCPTPKTQGCQRSLHHNIVCFQSAVETASRIFSAVDTALLPIISMFYTTISLTYCSFRLTIILLSQDDDQIYHIETLHSRGGVTMNATLYLATAADYHDLIVSPMHPASQWSAPQESFTTSLPLPLQRMAMLSQFSLETCTMTQTCRLLNKGGRCSPRCHLRWPPQLTHPPQYPLAKYTTNPVVVVFVSMPTICHIPFKATLEQGEVSNTDNQEAFAKIGPVW